MVAPQSDTPTLIFLLASLIILSLIALSRAQQLIDMDVAIRQRLRLIPGLNLWAEEQLLRDILREQRRCQREGTHAEIFILHMKRHQLWPTAHKLCDLTHMLRATDPNDSDCNAYHIDMLKERLHSEYQRAEMLNKQLTLLVLHLPQLDMAEEQFGQRAKTALLGALCSEVNNRCRDHDVLGRTSNPTFCLVLPDTSESGALLVRERLQRALSRCVLVETGQLGVRIAACIPTRAESFERYLSRLEARGAAIAHA